MTRGAEPRPAARSAAAAAAAREDELAELTERLFAHPDREDAVRACYRRLHQCGRAPLPSGLVNLYALLLARAGKIDAAEH